MDYSLASGRGGGWLCVNMAARSGCCCMQLGKPVTLFGKKEVRGWSNV